jgi:hypothetical protein
MFPRRKSKIPSGKLRWIFEPEKQDMEAKAVCHGVLPFLRKGAFSMRSLPGFNSFDTIAGLTARFYRIDLI